MQDRIKVVLRSNDIKEVKRLLIEYHNALVNIKDTLEDEDIWMDKQTPLGLYIDMHIQEQVND